MPPLTPEVRLAVTHNGKFHADEVAATAVLQYLYPDLTVIRSRDEDVINSADIVYDVGGIYDHSRRRYDHHQNGALKRNDGLTRSAFGLIWLHYGLQYCDDNERVADRIDAMLVRGIDARDNSELPMTSDFSMPDYGISQVIEQLNPILERGESYDEQFKKAVARMADLLDRIKQKIAVEVETEDEILALRAVAQDQRYVIMDRQVVPPESLAAVDGLEYLIFPEQTNHTWQVYAIPTPENQFVAKHPFPEAWAGLMNDDIARVSGVEDAIFCHRKRFLAVATSQDGARELLAKALE